MKRRRHGDRAPGTRRVPPHRTTPDQHRASPAPDLAAEGEPGGRDPAADRALFEQAVERLGSVGAKDLDERPPRVIGAPRRSARFSRRAARGEVAPAAVLDLHGLDRTTAAERLRQFLRVPHGEAVLVIHGRGRGILEATVVSALDAHPRVAEHVCAPPALGGAGARLVRLRLG